MKHIIPIVFCLIVLAAAGWFGYVLIENTKPTTNEQIERLIEAIKSSPKGVELVAKRIETCKQTTTEYIAPADDTFPSLEYLPVEKTIVTTKEIPQESKTAFSDKDLDALLKSVALTARKEAADEYKNNFSILLTILTIFGIVWPVIVTIFQSQQAKLENKLSLKKFEQDLDDMRECENMEFADIFHSNEWFWNFEIERYQDLINDKTEEITQAQTNGADPKTMERLEKEKKNLKNSLYALMKNRAKSLMKIIYFYAIAAKIKQADSKVRTLIDLLDSIQNSIDKKETNHSFYVEEIKWDLFENSGVKDAVDIRKKFCLIFSEDRNKKTKPKDSES